MPFKGYFSFGGTELINSERTTAYVLNQMPTFGLSACEPAPDLARVLGDERYESPLVDYAPWVDESNPATYDFYGFYPLDIIGISDSTSQMSTTESIVAGGSLGVPRDTTREMKFSGLLIAANALGLEAGMTWIKSVVTNGGCGDATTGQDLCYFAAPPELVECYHDYETYPDAAWIACATDELDPSKTCVWNARTMGDGNGTSYYNYYGSIHQISDDQAALMLNSPQQFGMIAASDPPVTYRLPDRDAKFRATWTVQPTDGLIFQIGARDGATIIEHSDNIISRRTNYFRNPAFRTANYWSLIEGAGVLTPQVAADGNTYLDVVPAAPSTTVRNVVADPSFENLNPGEVGASSTGFGGLLVTNDLTAGGGRVAYTSQNASEPDVAIDIPLLSGGFTGAAISLDVARTTSQLSVQIVRDETVAFSVAIPTSALGSTWNRIKALAPIAIEDGDLLRIRTVGKLVGQLKIDRIRVSASTDSPDDFVYFDGQTPAAAGVAYVFADGTPSSESLRVVRSVTTQILASENVSVQFGRGFASVDLRSDDAAQVILRLVAFDTDDILSSALVAPGADWETYTLVAENMRNVRLEVEAIGAYAIRRAVIESASTPSPYFDGNTPTTAIEGVNPKDYEIVWVGVPDESVSRLSYIGSLSTEICGSEWQPYLDVIAGSTAPSVAIEAAPAVTAEEQSEKYERQLRRVGAITGPKVTQEYAFKNAAVEAITFTLSAATPYIFSSTKQVVSNLLVDLGNNGSAGNPDAIENGTWDACRSDDGGTSCVWNARTMGNGLGQSFYADKDGIIHTISDSKAAAMLKPLMAILDPLCETPPPPPRPPVVPNPCFEENQVFNRIWVEIPQTEVSRWSDMLPTLTLSTYGKAVRNTRVRFYPNPFGYSADEIDALSYCAEFIISYLPPYTELIVDGTINRATATPLGMASVAAGNLLYGTGGAPMTWPALSCGVSYLMSLDTSFDPNESLTIDLSLTRRE